MIAFMLTTFVKDFFNNGRTEGEQGDHLRWRAADPVGWAEVDFGHCRTNPAFQQV